MKTLRGCASPPPPPPKLSFERITKLWWDLGGLVVPTPVAMALDLCHALFHLFQDRSRKKLSFWILNILTYD